jgi:hypothetical protein
VFSAQSGLFICRPQKKAVRMFGTYPAREILMWIGGMLLAAVIAIFGVTCLVDAYLAFHDPADALAIQRDLKSGQDDPRE